MGLFKKQAGKKPAVPENIGFLKKEKVLNCPKDQTPMIKLTNRGITVDKCRKCGGIWLDKGEMRKIIEGFDAHQKELAKQQEQEHKNNKKK